MARRTLLILLSVPLFLTAASAQAKYDPALLFPLSSMQDDGPGNGPTWPFGDICLRPMNSPSLTKTVRHAIDPICYFDDPTPAAKRIEPLARHGDATAQAALGFLYDYGYGVRKNAAAALKWYWRAARKGNANAEYILGRHYESGQGVKKNAPKALALFTRAANHKLLQAQKHLGDMYLNGTGVRKEPATAFRWYSMVAGQDVAEISVAQDRDEDHGAAAHNELKRKAQYALGKMYQTGQGVARNAIFALNWYALSQEAAAAFDAGQMFLRGDGVAQNHIIAAHWFQQSAKLDYGPAEYQLAQMYENGDGIRKDLTWAVKWYAESAHHHIAGAQSKLDRLRAEGQGIPKDEKATKALLAQGAKALVDRFALNRFKTAVPLLLPLAEKGDAVAQTALGVICEQIACFDNTPEGKVDWFEAAAAQGNLYAMYKIAKAKYDNGKPAGMELLKKAAELGSADAQLALASIVYIHDRAAAIKWDKLAAKQGGADAQIALAVMYAVDADMGRKADRQKNLTLAFKWNARGAAQGGSGCGLVEAYAKGEGVAKSPTDAMYWGLLCSRAVRLGQMLHEGKDVPRNDTLAALWFGTDDVAEAKYHLGLMYEHGYGVHKNKAKAIALFTKAAEADQEGSLEAQLHLANLFYRGHGVPKNLKVAFKWFKKAADMYFNGQADFMIGQMYEKGEAVAADKAQAIKWYERATGNGSKDAKLALRRLQK